VKTKCKGRLADTLLIINLTKGTTMVYDYQGHYQYNKVSVTNNASEEMGVYYCGYVNANNILITHYVGRAKGDGVSIRSRLLDHLRQDNWPDVSHFGYRVCTTKKEAEDLEASEIQRLKPRYNTQGKSYSW